MTAPRVLATQQAEAAAKQLLSQIQPIKDGITKIGSSGKTLEDKNNWDGPAADKWRADWDNDWKNLSTAANALDDLQKRVQTALDNIIKAGS